MFIIAIGSEGGVCVKKGVPSSKAGLFLNTVIPIAQVAVINPAVHNTHLTNYFNCPVAFTAFVDSSGTITVSATNQSSITAL